MIVAALLGAGFMADTHARCHEALATALAARRSAASGRPEAIWANVNCAGLGRLVSRPRGRLSAAGVAHGSISPTNDPTARRG